MIKISIIGHLMIFNHSQKKFLASNYDPNDTLKPKKQEFRIY